MLYVICNEKDFPANDVLLCRMGGFMVAEYDGRPAVFAHSRPWAALSERQQAWVIAHEEGHVLNGDLETDPEENLLQKECAADAHAKAVTGLTREELVELFNRLDDVRTVWAEELGLPTQEDPHYAEISLARLVAY